MEIGIDSFASTNSESKILPAISIQQSMGELLDRIEFSDQVGLDVFGIGEHHRSDFLDSSPAVILAAAAAKTKSIRLTSAVTVLSAADPVRVFQQFATLDIISNGRAEMVIGRGSFSEAFPLFGYRLEDYDDIFDEKSKLLLKIRDQEIINWSGKFRAELVNQKVYPRPIQDPLPIWIGVGGTPSSCVRAGTLGVPLMIAIIGGETHRFKYQVECYKKAGLAAGFSKETLKVGIHSIGYVAEDSQTARDDFYPGYAEVFTKIGKERGWPPVTRSHFDKQVNETGALLVGSPEEVANKIIRHSRALGGLSRVTFQMNVASLPHQKLMKSIELIGKKVVPILNASL
ncbi:LLM class flavin-dependent oxidoreductase [Candidatus Marinamargulisbacteria bacterium SCGC AG-410-N11]|nr:LLM class flavin-dependent oxidoreductase [Candidatus Marinamargulisbacteria bacterium SCGC AG-410-N11]